MEAAREEITRLSRRISHLVGEDHGAILQAQLMILQDSTVERDLAGCLAAGLDRRVALWHEPRQVCRDVSEADQSVLPGANLRHQGRLSTDPLALAPAGSGRDARPRSGWSWSPTKPRCSISSRSISITWSEWSWNTVGPHSHAVIIARSLGIPMVGQVLGAVRHSSRPGNSCGSTAAPDRSISIRSRPTTMATTLAAELALPSVDAHRNGQMLGHVRRPARDAPH